MKNIFKKDNIRNKHVVASLFVIGLILMVVGISYAMYTFTGTGTKENVITTGQITVEFAEQNNILIQNRYPETDTVGLASTDPNSQMTFTVSSNIVGNATVNYAVGLVEIQEGTTLTQDYIKINLTKNGSAATGFTSTTGNTIGSFKNETFSDLLTSHVIARGSVTGTQTDTYTLKAWIHEDYNLPTTDTSSGKVHSSTTTSEEFSFKIKVAGTDAITSDEEEPNIPNAPELATNMIPVTYDSANDTWVKADSTNTNDSWYNYDNKVWANAVTVTEQNRDTYVKATPGTPISMDDINTMWVWIPRFSATIGSIDCSTVIGATYNEYPMCYDIILTDDDKEKLKILLGELAVTNIDASLETLLNGGTIDVMGMNVNLAFLISVYNANDFENSIVPKYEYNSNINTNAQSFDIRFTRTSETSHDAFIFGDDELSGLWVGKFEPSHPTLSNVTEGNLLGCMNEICENAKGIEILPNKVSLRNNNVSNFFYAGRSLEQVGNNYGLVANEIDTHMMKNNEWGAVAYLTYSEFGRCTDELVCTDIGINNNGSREDYSNITGYGAPAGSADAVTNGVYNTALGMDASTTGNIYGVYDMSGGAAEYVMGVYSDGSRLWSGSESSWNSGFNGCIGVECASEKLDGLAFPDSKYYNVYTTSDAYKSSGLQHAITETNGWLYSDGAAFIFDYYPWFDRGGDFSDVAGAGVFNAIYSTGDDAPAVTFRPVLVK